MTNTIVNGEIVTLTPEENKSLEEERVELRKRVEERKKIKYKRDRKIAYPEIGDQLDMIYWDKKNGTKKWEEAIDKVKADHPKG